MNSPDAPVTYYEATPGVRWYFTPQGRRPYQGTIHTYKVGPFNAEGRIPLEVIQLDAQAARVNDTQNTVAGELTSALHAPLEGASIEPVPAPQAHDYSEVPRSQDVIIAELDDALDGWEDAVQDHVPIRGALDRQPKGTQFSSFEALAAYCEAQIPLVQDQTQRDRIEWLYKERVAWYEQGLKAVPDYARPQGEPELQRDPEDRIAA